MAYEGPFSKRQIDNMIHIVESDLQFSAEGQAINTTPIILDATDTFSKDITGRVTDNPVGDKSDRADNYRVYSPTVSFSGVISNDLIVSLFGFGSATSLYDWAFSKEDTSARCQQYLERMEKIFNEKRLVSIRMPDGLTTDNCLITSLKISRDVNWSNGFRISVVAKQIQLLSVELKSTPVETYKEKLDSGKDGGKKTGTNFDQFEDLIAAETELKKAVTDNPDGIIQNGET